MARGIRLLTVDTPGTVLPLEPPQGDVKSIDFADLFERDDLCCLKVEDGRSRGLLVERGDYVLFRRQETAGYGDVVVALSGGKPLVRRCFSDSAPVLGVVQSVIRPSV